MDEPIIYGEPFRIDSGSPFVAADGETYKITTSGRSSIVEKQQPDGAWAAWEQPIYFRSKEVGGRAD